MLFLAQHYFSTTKDKWRASSFVPWFPRMRFPSSTIALLAVAVALLCAKTLIGICFLDAPRFKENCFCVGFISFPFYAFLRAWQRLFKATLRGVLAVFAEHVCGNGRRLRCMANLPGVT